MITQEVLKELLRYDPESGVFSSYRTGKAVGWIVFQGRGKKKMPYVHGDFAHQAGTA